MHLDPGVTSFPGVGRHTVPTQSLISMAASRRTRAKSFSMVRALYCGCLCTCAAHRLCSLPLILPGSYSPATTLKLGVRTQCAAVSTQSGWISCPPHHGIPSVDQRRPTCHLHSHSVAGWPFTIDMLGALATVDGPLTPQVDRDRCA